MTDAIEAQSVNDADLLAHRVATAMYARDRASQALGMTIGQVRAGRAELTMRVRGDMLNGHSTCHGGLIFALADSAFAFACNSYNLTTVASGCSIEFLAPAREGDTLTALADSAFAFACNSYNLTTVASGCSIEFLAPAREGDTLTAVAQERSAAGRTGVYDIDVRNQADALIAVFRGKSYHVKGSVIDEMR